MNTRNKYKYPPLDLVAPAVFAMVFIVTLIYSRLEPHVIDVDMEYVKNFAGKPGYILVDARSEDTYIESHIPGSISFPIDDLKIAAPSAALAHAGITKKNTIIIYDTTGSISGRFADQLVRRFNFSASKIKNYRGGITDWVKYPENTLLTENYETEYE